MRKATPAKLAEIERRARDIGFGMNSDFAVGELLMALAASKPGGHFLEMGTGCGLGAAWLLAGMDADARLVTVDVDERPMAVARECLGDDTRIAFICDDGGAVLGRTPPASFDLVFADSWPGKFTHLDEALAAVKPGGIYLADDLDPQPNWPDGHQAAVDAYRAVMRARNDFHVAEMGWSTGLLLAVKR